MASRDQASNNGGGSRKEMPEKLTWKEYEKLGKSTVRLWGTYAAPDQRTKATTAREIARTVLRGRL